MAETKQDKLLRYLNDAYATEMGGIASLKDIIAVVTDADAKAALQEHHTVAQAQAERLTARILALGGDKSEPKAIYNQVMSKVSDLVNIFHDRADKQTQDVIKAYALDHFEVGMYASLYGYAHAIGDTETAALAQRHQTEEQQAADKILPLIPRLARTAVEKAAD